MPQDKIVISDEEYAEYPKFLNKWEQIFLQNERYSMERKKEIVDTVNALYKKGGYEPPKVIAFCASPAILRYAGGMAEAAWEQYPELIAHSKNPAFNQVVCYETAENTVDAFNALTLMTRPVAPVEPLPEDDLERLNLVIYLRENFKEIHRRTETGSLGSEYSRTISTRWDGGNQWASNCVVNDFVSKLKQRGSIDFSLWEIYQRLAEISSHRVCSEFLCVISEFPTETNYDEDNQAGVRGKPYQMWSDGSATYYYKGMTIPSLIVRRPDLITPKMIQEQENVEIRRVMLDTYGTERFIQDVGSKVIAEDNFGKLYYQEVEDDEPLVYVRVTNSTPETDGSFKDYWLRVPPGTKTPKEGVAWSFGIGTEDYNPLVES